jgi:hypothetical protein
MYLVEELFWLEDELRNFGVTVLENKSVFSLLLPWEPQSSHITMLTMCHNISEILLELYCKGVISFCG